MILVALQLLYPRAWLYQEQRPFVLDLLGATVKKISECMNILKGRTVIMDGDADLSFSGHREGDLSASEELRPLCPHTLFWFFSFLLWPLLICRFILLHLATKCGNSSKLVLDPYIFLSYTLPTWVQHADVIYMSIPSNSFLPQTSLSSNPYTQ